MVTLPIPCWGGFFWFQGLIDSDVGFQSIHAEPQLLQGVGLKRNRVFCVFCHSNEVFSHQPGFPIARASRRISADRLWFEKAIVQIIFQARSGLSSS